MQDYENLKLILEKEIYPHSFSFKFIGKNSAPFQQGVDKLLNQFPKLVMRTQRLSQNQNHVSYTYSLQAQSAEAIIEVFRVIEKLPDLEIIL